MSRKKTAETAEKRHRRGRPPLEPLTAVYVRLRGDDLIALKAWIVAKRMGGTHQSRPEAVRELMRIGLGLEPNKALALAAEVRRRGNLGKGLSGA